MNTPPHIALSRLLTPLLLLSLVASACASKPTPVPTARPLPTPAPTKALPTVAPTKAPTAAPAQKATVKPQPTTAPTSVPTPQPTPSALALGTEQVIGDVGVMPSKTETLTASGADKPKAGDIFLAVTVTIENKGQSDFVFDPASLVMMDPVSGATISLAALKSLSNALKVQDLKAGAKITGVVAYEVPQQDMSRLELMYKYGTQNALWKLAG